MGLFFLHFPRRGSKGAGVNDLPVAGQSRAPARPQAGSPVRVTKKQAPLRWSLFISLDAASITDPAGDQRHPLQNQGGGVQPVPAQLGAGQAADGVLAVKDEFVQA